MPNRVQNEAAHSNKLFKRQGGVWNNAKSCLRNAVSDSLYA